MNGFLADTKRQRGGRKKRKKGKEEKTVIQDWDDIYDLSRPNVYDDYKNSEEQYREVREWKDRLYAHRFMKERRSSASSSDSDRGRSNINSTLSVYRFLLRRLITVCRRFRTTAGIFICAAKG